MSVESSAQSTARTVIEVPNSQPMVALLGTGDEYIRQVEKAFPDVDLLVRGNQIALSGDTEDVAAI